MTCKSLDYMYHIMPMLIIASRCLESITCKHVPYYSSTYNNVLLSREYNQ